MERITVRLHAWQREALDAAACARGVTVSRIVRGLIEDAADADTLAQSLPELPPELRAIEDDEIARLRAITGG